MVHSLPNNIYGDAFCGLLFRKLGMLKSTSGSPARLCKTNAAGSRDLPGDAPQTRGCKTNAFLLLRTQYTSHLVQYQVILVFPSTFSMKQKYIFYRKYAVFFPSYRTVLFLYTEVAGPSCTRARHFCIQNT